MTDESEIARSKCVCLALRGGTSAVHLKLHMSYLLCFFYKQMIKLKDKKQKQEQKRSNKHNLLFLLNAWNKTQLYSGGFGSKTNKQTKKVNKQK